MKKNSDRDDCLDPTLRESDPDPDNRNPSEVDLDIF